MILQSLQTLGVAAACWTICGCGSAVDVCFFESGEAVYQLSPSLRAVAFVNPTAYAAILNQDPSVTLNYGCIANEFASQFENAPDSMVVVLDFEHDLAAMSRMMFERGFEGVDPDQLRELPPSEIERYAEALDEVLDELLARPQPTSAGLNATMRSFERSIGEPVPWFQPKAGGPALRGYVFLPAREELVSGRFLHEFAHYWAAHLTGPPSLATQVRMTHGHWGFTSVGGLLGGWAPGTPHEDEPGLYRVKAAPAGRQLNQQPYAPLELYVMGLAPPQEVPDVQVAVDPRDFDRNDEFENIFRASGLETVTIDEIIAANGPRRPAYGDAPTHFKLALVILTDHELTDDEWDFYERSIDFMSAEEEQFLDEVFPAERYRAHHSVWHEFSEDEMEENDTDHFVYLNFHTATAGRGSLEFVRLIRRSDGP